MIREYINSDRTVLCDFFSRLIEHHKGYISHGELQMGLATDTETLAPNHKQIWLEYLDRQLQDDSIKIYIYEIDDAIEGFIISGIDSDNASPYGVVYDMGVNPMLRGRSIGSELLEKAISRLTSEGIDTFYLESGVANHSAHKFFEKFGFKHVSNIFRMKQGE